MLPDFATAYRDFISDDGSVKPSISVPVPPDQTWAVDPDGLLMTTAQYTMEGGWCLLSVLFPMPLKAAQAKHRKRHWPARYGDHITVLRRLDEVVGHEGERYSRFTVKVIQGKAITAAGAS